MCIKYVYNNRREWVVWCPIDKMIADLLTKPLQGKVFVEFRNKLKVVV